MFDFFFTYFWVSLILSLVNFAFTTFPAFTFHYCLDLAIVLALGSSPVSDESFSFLLELWLLLILWFYITSALYWILVTLWLLYWFLVGLVLSFGFDVGFYSHLVLICWLLLHQLHPCHQHHSNTIHYTIIAHHHHLLWVSYLEPFLHTYHHQFQLSCYHYYLHSPIYETKQSSITCAITMPSLCHHLLQAFHHYMSSLVYLHRIQVPYHHPFPFNIWLSCKRSPPSSTPST